MDIAIPVSPVHDGRHVDAPVRHGGLQIIPVKLFLRPDLTRLGTAIVAKPMRDKQLLLFRKKSAGLGRIRQHERQAPPDNNRRDALEDKNPPPPPEPADAGHLLDPKREEPREGGGQGRGGEEDGHAGLDLEAAVPGREEVARGGEEACLTEA